MTKDMNIPMHFGDKHDRGGNDTQVRFYDRGMNMHSLWDSGMIERVSRSEDYWLRELAVLPSAQRPEPTGKRIKPGAKLGDAYVEANEPVVRRRLYQAGVRLAMVLNEAFAETETVGHEP
jgi:S1/P1 Nuclease